MFPETQTASHSKLLVLAIEFAGHLGLTIQLAQLRCIEATCCTIAISLIDLLDGCLAEAVQFGVRV